MNDDLSRLNQGVCPDCGDERFVMGPSGGMAHNIRCAGCGHKFWFSPPFPPMRIDNDDSFYTRAPINLREELSR